MYHIVVSHPAPAGKVGPPGGRLAALIAVEVVALVVVVVLVVVVFALTSLTSTGRQRMAVLKMITNNDFRIIMLGFLLAPCSLHLEEAAIASPPDSFCRLVAGLNCLLP